MESPVKVWRNQKKITPYIGKVGVIIAWTTIRTPPSGFENQAPYIIAIIELDSGNRFTCQLVDSEEKELSIGIKVRLVIRRSRESSVEGIIPYGLKAVLLR
jgi:uncharacterized protein